MTAGTGTWSGTAPITYAYQWQDCNGASCADIPGATNATYTVGGADAGMSIQVIVTATNVVGSTSATSANTAVVTGPPFSVGLPNISGTAQVGNVLTATPGTWAGNNPISYAYQWQSCVGVTCSNIAGATNATYTIVSGDNGKTLLVKVAATNAYGTGNATSAKTNTITSPPVNTAVPAITGTVQAGYTLTASTGTWTGAAPITYTYQWQRCPGATCSNIAGATGSTYFVTSRRQRQADPVVVTATNGTGSTNATSAKTSTVTVTYATSVVVTVTNTLGTTCGSAGVVFTGGPFASGTSVSATTVRQRREQGQGDILGQRAREPVRRHGVHDHRHFCIGQDRQPAAMTTVTSGANTGPTIKVSAC